MPPTRAPSGGGGQGPVRFTVAGTLCMLDMGILPQDSTIELLNGTLVYRDRFDIREGENAEGIDHNYILGGLADLAAKINSDARHLRTQCTLICSETHAPIPDAVVLSGPKTSYRDHIPTAAEAICVIEVADSSYERDAGEKLVGYARAGVMQYIIINLRNRTAEAYNNPDSTAGTYPPPQIVAESQALSIRVAEGEIYSTSLRDLLP
jgi:Uma2 family endonuclease